MNESVSVRELAQKARAASAPLSASSLSARNQTLLAIAEEISSHVPQLLQVNQEDVEQARKEKEARKKQKTIEIKEIRLSPNIDTNDLNTKINAAKKFLTKGDKVKVTLRFRGREMAHMNASKHILDDFAEALTEIAVVEKPAKVEGRSMTMVLAEKRS